MKYIFVARNSNDKWCVWIAPWSKGEIVAPVKAEVDNKFHQHVCYAYIKKHAISLAKLQKIPYERIILL